MFKLYHYWRSSCSWRLRWALVHKNLKFKTIAINLLAAEQRDAGYQSVNPGATVPTLITPQGYKIKDSLAAIEWLEECFPNPALLPSEPSERAKVRELALLVASQIQPLQNLRVLNVVSSEPETRQEWARRWIIAGLAAFEASVSAQGQFSCGEKLSLADLCLVPQCYNARRFEINLANFPRVKEIYHHCLETEGCKQSAPEAYASKV